MPTARENTCAYDNKMVRKMQTNHQKRTISGIEHHCYRHTGQSRRDTLAPRRPLSHTLSPRILP